jgi:hypothetical protein
LRFHLDNMMLLGGLVALLVCVCSTAANQTVVPPQAQVIDQKSFNVLRPVPPSSVSNVTSVSE